ncbi:MAG: single-stranded-DNA-specific exonuclease RecJ [Candidatus Omnitrophica bacterium]|nr:single-stranded-DNA-specific exonuclease RecJ [Candidatus Omnitrophota bacterium]
MRKIIKIAQPDKIAIDNLSKELGISRILAQILVNRKIESASEAERFLRPKLDHLHNPLQLKGMRRAVSRVKQALDKKEKVLVCGDYDVDGLTSMALLLFHLQELGLHCISYIPHRLKDGYGLNRTVIDIAKKENISLIITVDCGISDFFIIEQLQKQGIDVIVTDHHEARERQSNAFAVIDPKQDNCPYPYKELAGVGVVFKFIQALLDGGTLRGETLATDRLAQDLDLVALGTIADMVALNGENRIIAKEGLKRLVDSSRLGINALFEVSRVKKRKIEPETVSYILAPRLNASGRIGSAESSLKLLLSQDNVEAAQLANEVNLCNQRRKKIEERILKEAEAQIEREINFKEDYIMVIAGSNWHPGVIGIVASKLMQRFLRPTIIISESETLCKGSARSIKNFSIFEALLFCEEYLEDFGGHIRAAGLVIFRENIAKFREKINCFAKNKLSWQDFIPSLEIDSQIELSDLDERLIEELDELMPYGAANPKPLFYTANLKLVGSALVLRRDTLKFWVSDGKRTFAALGFGMAPLKEKLSESNSFDLIYYPQIDEWQGNQNIILEVKEIIFTPFEI